MGLVSTSGQSGSRQLYELASSTEPGRATSATGSEQVSHLLQRDYVSDLAGSGLGSAPWGRETTAANTLLVVPSSSGKTKVKVSTVER